MSDKSVAEFKLQTRVYYEDTDAAGIVYHANYLKFMERARTEWLRQLGYSQFALATRHGVGFVVRKMTIAFILPARLDDELEVASTIIRTGKASMIFDQRLRCETKTLCTATVKVGCIDLQHGGARAMPEQLYLEIKNAS